MNNIYRFLSILEIYAGGIIQVAIVGMCYVCGILKMNRLEEFLEGLLIKSFCHSFDVLDSVGVDPETVIREVKSNLIIKNGVVNNELIDKLEESYFGTNK